MQIDPNSPTWHAIKAWAEERRISRTRTCTTPGTPADETEQARGALLELELLLDLAEAKKHLVPSHSTDFSGE